VNTLLERAEQVPLTSAGKYKEKKHVDNILMNNNYPLWFIKSATLNAKPNNMSQTAMLQMKYKHCLLFYHMKKASLKEHSEFYAITEWVLKCSTCCALAS